MMTLHSMPLKAAPMTSDRLRLLLVPLLPILLAACDTRQLYDAGQAYQRNRCDRLVNPQEHEQCLDAAGPSYDDYRRARDETSQ